MFSQYFYNYMTHLTTNALSIAITPKLRMTTMFYRRKATLKYG